jgi:hypothetical protein
LILTAFASAMPNLQPYLEKAEIEVGTNHCEDVIMRTVNLFNDDLKAQAK